MRVCVCVCVCVSVCVQTSSVSLTVLQDDVQDFVSYVDGYYRLQVTGHDDKSDDDGLVVKTLDQHATTTSSSSSSENGLINHQCTDSDAIHIRQS